MLYNSRDDNGTGSSSTVSDSNHCNLFLPSNWQKACDRQENNGVISRNKLCYVHYWNLKQKQKTKTKKQEIFMDHWSHEKLIRVLLYHKMNRNFIFF